MRIMVFALFSFALILFATPFAQSFSGTTEAKKSAIKRQVHIDGARCNDRGLIHFSYEDVGTKKHGVFTAYGDGCKKYKRGQRVVLFFDSENSEIVTDDVMELDNVRSNHRSAASPWWFAGWIFLIIAYPFIKFISHHLLDRTSDQKTAHHHHSKK